MDINSKEFKELVEGSKNPEVIKGIILNMNAIGEDSKKNFETLQKDFHEIKALIESSGEKLDPLVKEQVEKLGDSVTIRQDEAEKKMNERMDDFETAIQRLPKGYDNDPALMAKEAEYLESFRKHSLAIKSGEVGLDAKRYNAQKEAITAEAYEAYKKEFEYVLRHDDKHITPEQYKDLSVGIDPDGGYAVTPVMSSRIIQRVWEMDPIRQIAAVESISTGAIEWLVDYDEAGGGWESETVVTTDTTTPQFNYKRIPVHPLASRPKATQTLLEDSGINIESWLAGHVARKFGRIEGAAFVNGDGVNKPRGFLTYPTYTTAGTDKYGEVEQIAMGHATELTADGFSNVKYAMVEDLMDRGTWLMNRTTVREAMQLKDGEGRYIWQPGLQAGQPSMILALPVRMSTTMPTIAANALSVALADWAEFYMIVDRLGITIQRDPFTVKPFVEFYSRKRVGGDVINYQAGKIGKVSV